MKNAASLTFHKHIIKIIKPWAMDSTTTIGILANKLKIRSTFIFILKLRKIQAFINIKMDKNNTCNTTHKCICMHFYLYSLLISRIIILAFSSFCNFLNFNDCDPAVRATYCVQSDRPFIAYPSVHLRSLFRSISYLWI